MRISDWSSDVCSSDLLVAADAVDAREQRGDRLRAIGLDRGHVQAAGPEVAAQFLHMVLRRLHRRVDHVALLLLCKVAQLAQGHASAAALDSDVGPYPFTLLAGVEVVLVCALVLLFLLLLRACPLMHVR